MDGYENNSVWDFKFISAEKDVKRYKCCPNDTFPRITYVFLISRHHGVKSMSNITPAIGERNRSPRANAMRDEF